MPKHKLTYSVAVLEQRDLSIVTVPLYKEPNFSVVPIKFMTTTHRNDCNSTESITVKENLKSLPSHPLNLNL